MNRVNSAVPNWGPHMPLKNIRNVTQRQQNSQRNNLLRAAIRNNNITEFRELGDLSEKDITTKDNRGYTLLHEAALARTSEFLRAMLPKRTCTNVLLCRPKKKIDINVQDNDGNTSLMIAVYNPYPGPVRNEIIQLLKDNGANVNNASKSAYDIATEHERVLDRRSFFKAPPRPRAEPKELLVRPTVPSNFGPINPNGPKELPVPPPAAASYTNANIARYRRIKGILGEKVPPPPPSRPLQAPRGWAPPREDGSKQDGGYRKKTARKNKGHTNVSRRWRRTSRVLRSSRVATRKTGRRASRRTRRWNTAFVA